jgi:hypothetical protein
MPARPGRAGAANEQKAARAPGMKATFKEKSDSD